MDKLTRRNIRYICFRLQTEAEGGPKAKPDQGGIMSNVLMVKKRLEAQEEFGGWKKFAKTWDVGEKETLVAVSRFSSIQNDWNKVLKKEAKDLPLAKEKKETPATTEIAAAETPAAPPPTPPRGPGGKFVSKKKSFWDNLT
jgi:hypothetical protein